MKPTATWGPLDSGHFDEYTKCRLEVEQNIVKMNFWERLVDNIFG